MSSVDEAFQQINRVDFIPEPLKYQNDVDAPLPIGFGQTISQPTTVRLMLEWLQVKPGNKIMDIGSGSGWTTALLSRLTGPEGKVYAVERISELLEFGRSNCQRVGIKNVKFYKAGKEYGLPQYAPFDRILVSAAARELPEKLLLQLKIGGKLVIPIRHDILEINKISSTRHEVETHGGFTFVPLI